MKRKTYQEIKQVKQIREIEINEDESEIINLKTKKKAIIVKSEMKINGKKIKVTIDIRIARSIITKRLIKKLDMKIKEPSKMIFRVVNRNKIPSLEETEIHMKNKKRKLPIVKV